MVQILKTLLIALLLFSPYLNAQILTVPNGGTGQSTLPSGQALYGNGAQPVQAVATELAADTFPGADICAKVMAAQAALPATGGVIVLSAQNYPVCAASITINVKNVTLRGAGMGNWGLGTAATVLNFPAGVSGIVSTSEITVVKSMMIKSGSTAAGSDNGISFAGGSPRVERVIVKGFGGRGVVFNNNTDLWRLDSVYADSNKGDAFYWAPGCSDQNAGFAVGTSATNNGGIGYNIQCGSANYFQTTHASGNTGGAWMVNSTYNYIVNAYVEGGAGSGFTFAAGTAYNTAIFNAFGQPSPITDLGTTSTNQIYYEGAGGTDGALPAQTTFSLTGAPQNSPGAFYSFVADTGDYFPGDLVFRDRKHAVQMAYYANGHGWNFLTPVTIGIDNSIAGVLNISNGSLSSHTTIQSQASSNTLFNLPATNGISGQQLTTDGSGNLSWAAGSGGGGITNSAPANMVMKSDATNAIASSLSDNGTAITTTEPLTAATLSTGAGASGCPATGCFSLTEAGTAGTPNAGYDYCRADSVSHGLLCSFNGGAEAALGGAQSFSVITPGTNNGALIMGTGGTLTTSGTGTITATTAGNLTGTPALPNGTTATTQTAGDSSTKLATDAFVSAAVGGVSSGGPTVTSLTDYFCSGTTTSGSVGGLGWLTTTIGSAPVVSQISGTYPHRCILQLATATGATQGQGGSLSLGLGSQGWGDFGSNTNWSIRITFALQSTTSNILRVGLGGQANSMRPLFMGMLYDTNSPLSAAAMSTMTCSATVCTVTMSAAHGLVVPGQSFTIAGASCPSRPSINATYAYGSATGLTITTTTAFTFPSAGSSETCTAGTVTTVPMADFGFQTALTTVNNATTVDSGTAADTSWHTITISSTTAGTVQFKLDSGTAVNISTTVATGGLLPVIIIGSDITAQKTVQLNYWSYTESGLTR